MKIRPLHDRILVKRIDEEETTKGGIIIPDSAKEKPSEGKVIAEFENGRMLNTTPTIGPSDIIYAARTRPIAVARTRR